VIPVLSTVRTSISQRHKYSMMTAQPLVYPLPPTTHWEWSLVAQSTASRLEAPVIFLDVAIPTESELGSPTAGRLKIEARM